MKTSYLIMIVIFSFSSCRYIANQYAKKHGAEGYYDKNWEWVNTYKYDLPDTTNWKLFLNSYNDIPQERISIVVEQLDSTIVFDHCFKFISNSTEDKFVALFSANENTTTRKEKLKGGSSVSWSDKTNKDTISYIGYAVYGVLHDNNWYYNKEAIHHFYNTNIDAARKEFILRLLGRDRFFKFWNQTNFAEYWTQGEFEIVDSTGVLGIYQGYPITAAWMKVSEKGRLREELRDIISIAEIRFTRFIINSSDQKVKKISQNHRNIFLTNWERNLVLFQLYTIDGNNIQWMHTILYDVEQEELFFLKDSSQKKPTEFKDTATTFVENLELIFNLEIPINKWEIPEEQIFEEKFWSALFEKENGKHKFLIHI